MGPSYSKQAPQALTIEGIPIMTKTKSSPKRWSRLAGVAGALALAGSVGMGVGSTAAAASGTGDFGYAAGSVAGGLWGGWANSTCWSCIVYGDGSTRG